MSEERSRVLFVDDDPRLLAAVTRILHSSPFDIRTASDGWTALESVEKDGPYAVIVSDLRMPGMGGVELLQQVGELAPDTVRMLLTGQADLESAIGAINDGRIFRFITKPCPAVALQAAMRAATDQYRLVTSERVLLEQTLHGSIKALTEILSAVSPEAFGRATRLRQSVTAMMNVANIRDRWHIEVAAMLSQIACVTLPPETMHRLYHGDPLTPEEQAMLERAPAIAESVVGSIPRLDPVLAILRYQYKNYDGTGPPHDGVAGERIPWGARALHVVTDLDALEADSDPGVMVLDILRGRTGFYDPELIEVISEIRKAGHEAEVRELYLKDMRPGVVFAQDVRSKRGALILARGQEATPGVLERLHNFALTVGVREPIRVIVRGVAPIEDLHPTAATG
jgi:response regulator RpfG family c-di-GMP phosphodiesterase